MQSTREGIPYNFYSININAFKQMLICNLNMLVNNFRIGDIIYERKSQEKAMSFMHEL